MKIQDIIWVVPPPSNSGKWRFLGQPKILWILGMLQQHSIVFRNSSLKWVLLKNMEWQQKGCGRLEMTHNPGKNNGNCILQCFLEIDDSKMLFLNLLSFHSVWWLLDLQGQWKAPVICENGMLPRAMFLCKTYWQSMLSPLTHCDFC